MSKVTQQHQAAIEFSNLIGRLKTTPRTGWVRSGVPNNVESVAEHSWRVAALSLLLDDDSIDVAKTIQMGVLHDIAECLIGDICPEDNVSEADKQDRENKAVEQLVDLLQRSHSKHADYLVDILHEYEARQSNEAKAVKDLDLLDMILQADEYELQYSMDLGDFFSSTPPSKFKTKRVRDIAESVHAQRQKRIQQFSSKKPEPSGDDSFAKDLAQVSNIPLDHVRLVIGALRERDSTGRYPSS